MKIIDVKTHVLRYDLKEELGYAQGFFDNRTCHIVEVITDQGITGIGEVFGPGNIALGNSAIIENVLKPIIIGSNPLDHEVIWHKTYNALRTHGQKGMPIQCLSGIDIALWDLVGKFFQKPLYVLLGGKFREKIKVYGYGMLFRKVPNLEKVFADEALKIKNMGFKAMKMKIGISPEKDISLVRAVKEAIGDDIQLMVDADNAYTSTTAIPLGLKLDNMNVYWFEEPVSPEDHDGYREIKLALNTPVAGGEREFTRWGFRGLISNRCLDILQPEVCGCGGISEFRKIVAMALTWGIPIIPHVWGSAISVAVNLHLVASLPDFPGSLYPVEPMLEYDTTPNIFREELAVEPLNVLDRVGSTSGYVGIPEKPGIGIEMNKKIIDKYKIN